MVTLTMIMISILSNRRSKTVLAEDDHPFQALLLD
jgi:hypothetical protein